MRPASSPGALFFRALRLAVAAACAVHAASAGGADTRIRLLVQSSPLTGMRYYETQDLWSSLRVGDALELVREPANAHDGNAVQVRWRGHVLGYVPRRANATLAWALDRGDALRARISALERRRAARLEIEVLAE